MDKIIDAVRSVFFFLDNIIYKFIGIVYELLMEIANTTIFTEEIIDLFASKVYALLGIFMLFKVSFSIMTYIVNPDEFSDKNKGFSKLITNIIITLTLLIFTPWIFSQAMDIQRIVLKDNVIGKIFSTSASLTFMDGNDNTGEKIAYETFTAFYKIDEDYTECKDILINSNNRSSCQSALGINDKEYKAYISDTLEIAAAIENIDSLENYDLLNHQENDKYIMSYTPLISTVVGIFIIWILILFCFDVAVRSVKLGFLRIIAPIPIVSRIDPKGKGMFDKWFKNCISTYLDLFIRLLAIFFALFVIEQVFNMDFVNQTTGLPTEVDIFTKIFIIMGALLFAKQLPKLLSDLTGAKLDGKFTLNPFKRVAEVPLVGQAASRIGGTTGSLLTGNGFKAGWREGGKAVPLLGGDGKQSIAAGFNRFGLFSEDARKKREEREKSLRNYKQGESLLHSTLTEKIDQDGNVTMEVSKSKQYGIYNNKTYADSVRSVDDAKDRKNRIQSDYERLKMSLETEGASMDAASREALIKQVDDARIASAKADSDFEKVKKAHQELRKQNSKLAEIEDLFNAAKDEFEAKANVTKYYRNQESLTNNIQNIQTQIADVNGDSTRTDFRNVDVPIETEVTQNHQNLYEELANKEQQARKAVEQLETKFQRKRVEYYNAISDAAVPEEKRARIAKEYEEIQQLREEAIYEHEKALNELKKLVNSSRS